MERIERNRFHERLCQQSELLSALYLEDTHACTDEADRCDSFTVPLGYLDKPVNGVSWVDAALPGRVSEIEDLVLNGTRNNEDPTLAGIDGICRQAELHSRAINARGGHPFDIVISALAHIDPAERTRWYVVVHPAVWMEARLEAESEWFKAAVDASGAWKRVGGAHAILTTRMEDRSVLMFREDAVLLRLSDVRLSKTKTEPVADVARFELRLELDPDHVQLVHNLG